MVEVRYTRNLFLRGMCIIYLFAFLSLYVQIPGKFFLINLACLINEFDQVICLLTILLMIKFIGNIFYKSVNIFINQFY